MLIGAYVTVWNNVRYAGRHGTPDMPGAACQAVRAQALLMSNGGSGKNCSSVVMGDRRAMSRVLLCSPRSAKASAWATCCSGMIARLQRGWRKQNPHPLYRDEVYTIVIGSRMVTTCNP